jgi:hypothetical protein
MFAAACITVLAGCGSVVTTPKSSISPSQDPTPLAPTTTALFNPAAGDPTQIPLPNDLLRDPTTGLVDNFPQTAPFNAEPFTSLAAQQGFSTTGNIIIPFSGGIIPDSVNSSTLLLVESDTGAPVNCSYTVLNPFQSGVSLDSTVILQPQKALKPLTEYTAILTPNLQGSGGNVSSTALIELTKRTTPLEVNNVSTISGLSDADAVAAEPLRVAYQGVWASAENATGVPRAVLPFAFQFGTQPLFYTLQGLRQVAGAQNRGVVNSTIIAGGVSPYSVAQFYAAANLTGAPNASIGRICQGEIMMPDYIGNATTGYFQGSGPNVTNTGDRAVPYWACLPAGNGPFPTLIFQHGITRSRNDIFAIADGACQAGYAVVAIDLVLHGNLSLNPADPSSSGTGFINLSSLRTSRDNIRQSAVDLFYLSQAIVSGQGDVDPYTAGTELATTQPAFIGQSLGSIVGVDAVAIDPNMSKAVFNVPGGRISNLLLNSPTFSPQILAGLSLAGITPGTSNFLSFFFITQTVVDDADPMNYGTHLIDGALKGGETDTVLLQQAQNDTVIPGSSFNDLVYSTPGLSIVAQELTPLIGDALVGLPIVNAPFVGNAISQFPGASHGFILDPTAGPTAEAQLQALGFLSPAGNAAGTVTFSPDPANATAAPDPTNYVRAIYHK